MIIDKLKNSSLYEKDDLQLKAAFEFLRRLEKEGLQEGKYFILGDEVYADIFSYETMEPDKLKYEQHREYADIHYIRKGEEYIYWAELGGRQSETYNEETDVGFFSDLCGTAIPVQEGDIMILYPEDVHKPKCMRSNSSHVEKVVIKVRLKNLPHYIQ